MGESIPKALRPIVLGSTPDAMTDAARNFYVDHFRLNTFLADVVLIGSLAKANSPRTDAPLEQRPTDPLLEASVNLHEGSQGYLIVQMVVCRAVDNFLSYLSDLLAVVFRTRPETMRSEESESLKDILQFTEMQDLIAYLAEQRVFKLSQKGFGDLAKFMEKRIALPVTADPELMGFVDVAVNIRNLIVHNRGRVDRRFLQRNPGIPDLKIGHEFVYSHRGARDILAHLELVVRDLDVRAAAKLSLPTPHKRQDILPQRAAFIAM